jgi:hypothetical protein
MKKFSGLVLTLTAAIILGAFTAGCNSFETTQPASSTTTVISTSAPPVIKSTTSATPVSTTPISTLPTTVATPSASVPTLDQEAGMVEDFIKNSSTFKFDGIEGSLVMLNSGPGFSSAFRSDFFTFKFQTAHPGHGDRSGQILAQVITSHTVMVLVDSGKNTVASAICDRSWDMLHEKELPITVTGTVISGGDTTPAGGPLDAPRRFVYLVQKSDGAYVNVSYTAYPPSPAGKEKMGMIRLEFANGVIIPGDLMEAYGSYDSKTNTLTVAEAGNYIRTSVPRATVIGRIVSGGDTTPEGGPLDAPRKFIYEIEQDDHTLIHVSYTAYPPSPAGDDSGFRFALSLYNSSIKIGDYMKASGILDKAANTVMLTGPDDFLKTYPLKP